MRKWFAAPQRKNEYENFASRIIHHILLIFLALSATFSIFASSWLQLLFVPILLISFGICYFLLRAGHFRFASIMFLSGLWLIITLASFNINGIRNASISSYAVIIILSAVLLSDRTVITFTVLSIVSVIVLAVGESQSILPLSTTPFYLEDRLFQQIALFAASGILLTAASRAIRHNFERVRVHEQTLLEHNRQLENEIAERQRIEAKYRLLFENIPIMAGVYGQDGEIMLLNNTAASVLGGTPETLEGRNLRDVVLIEDAERAIQTQAAVIEENKPKIVEGSTTLPSGKEIHFLRHVMPLPKTENDSTSQVLVLTTDMTEKHLAEQRERELVLAREKNAFLTDFFGVVSHDLKTPLTIMNTSIYLLQRASTIQQREERILRITEQVQLMDRYIQDMLTISRLEHVPTFNFEPLNLNELIDEVVELLFPRIENKRLIHQFKPQYDLPLIEGDAEQLRRMLTNLIENAVNYTPSGGYLTVKTQSQHDIVKLDVIDSGIGIEPEAIPRIFERFFRTSTAKTSEQSGTGLGLAIVKKIVDMHGATIDVTSRVGQGTTFTLKFPVKVLQTPV
jgi:PAS domain S-box-containing protein